ncbi:MAG TPA: tryptophan--tRNA ligase [Rickettsiales bacterium]|nr:tryptophan--tRNA ligase [Rickettsiales bacterium]
MKKVILTGERPTGPLHLGHYVGSLQNRVKLQNDYNMFIMSADVQALTDNFENPQKIRDNVFEVILDNLAVGIDPKITKLFIQSQVPELTELTTYYMNLVTVARLERNPTIKTEIAQKGFEDSVPAGFLCYPVSQASDITAFGAEVVPVGDDQLPLLEQTNEIVRRFNRIYKTDILKECEAYLSKCTRLIGTDGNAKMSKSLGNTIYLKDGVDIIKQKVMSMYTDPNHIKVEDAGKVEGNTVFTYLDIFDENKNEVEELKNQYRKGGLGDVKIKKRLADILISILEPIQKLRKEYENNMDEVYKIVKNSNEIAREKAGETLQKVRKAIGIEYFN